MKTTAAYRYAVWSFLGFVGFDLNVGPHTPHRRIEWIDDIRREDILGWVEELKAKGDSPYGQEPRRSLPNFLASLEGRLDRHGERPAQVHQTKVRAYNPQEMAKLYEDATLDEADLLIFLLCTRAREQEAQFVCWPDVDLIRKACTVTEPLDLGYKPKDKKDGTLPIPDLLVDHLLARRKRYQRTRLIFAGNDGNPNGHALRLIKRLALRARVNCGLCVNKKGLSCANYPVRRYVLLRLPAPCTTTGCLLKQSSVTCSTAVSTMLAYLAGQSDD